jgi:hypothetical protein
MSGIISYTAFGGKSGLLGPTPSFRALMHSSTGSGVVIMVFVTTHASTHNHGGHYNTSTGYFTAPIKGLYQFNFVGLSTNSATQVDYSLWDGSTELSLMRSQGHSSHETIDGSFCIDIVAGTTIAIRKNGGVAAYGDSSTWSNFSGYLVCPT